MNIVNRLKKKIYKGDNFIDFSDFRYLPRWVVLLIDITLLVVSIYISSYILPFLKVNISANMPIEIRCSIVLLVNILFFYVLKTYAGIIRHSTFTDILKILLSSLFTLSTLVVLHFVYLFSTGNKLFNLPFLLLYCVSSCTLLFFMRMFVKEFYGLLKYLGRTSVSKKILVLGVDDQSISLARAIIESNTLPYQVKGFFTNRDDSATAKFLGKPTYSKVDIEELTKESLGVDGVIFIKENFTKEEINELVTFFLEKDYQIFTAPQVQKLQDSNNVTTIKNLQIEDLLNRKSIKIENLEVKKRHFEKSVLVTGGAGSIGSEIVRQVAMFNPSELVVLDQAETPLYEVELELRERFPKVNFQFVLADVRDYSRMQDLFEKHHFSMVYHAAAYKHVPLVEGNPNEGVMVNIIGSKNISSLSSQYKVNRFVMVSTDKAVNPTNVMGASKRAAELYVQSLQNKEGNQTKFITTRFGNVLGSNGSVIPHFKKQIEKGGPVTITHKDIVRYFMTIPEACNLVLQAGTMGTGGEIYVFDMGEPVKILDLAKRMIKLSGLEPDVDIDITFTGLRPGEKLYEELLSDGAKTLATHHEKIMISKDPIMAFDEINEYITEIQRTVQKQKTLLTVSVLKQIVPEFKSNNSIYEMLDK